MIYKKKIKKGLPSSLRSFGTTSAIRGGFTLLEIVVALGIVAVALVAIMALFATVLRTTKVSEDEIIAYNLAREGIEVVENIRQTWLFKDDDNRRIYWEDYGWIPGKEYIVNYNSKNLEEGDSRLYLQGLLYNHNGGSPTPFQRTVTLTEGEEDMLVVNVVVTWVTTTGQTNTINLEKEFAFWQ